MSKQNNIFVVLFIFRIGSLLMSTIIRLKEATAETSSTQILVNYITCLGIYGYA